MALLQYGTTQTFQGGPLYLQSTGGGSFAVFNASSGGGLYTDDGVTATQLSSNGFEPGGFLRLSDGSYLLYRQEYDLPSGGAHYEVLNADGSVRQGDTDAATAADGNDRAITGPTATATSNGGFLLGYTDNANAGTSTPITFTPPSSDNGGTTADPGEQSDVGYRVFAPPPTTGAGYQGGDFVTTNTGTFQAANNGGTATGPSQAGGQEAGGTATLANGTVVEAYLNQFFVPNGYTPGGNGGLSSANEIAFTLIAGSGVSDPVTVTENPNPDPSGTGPAYGTRGQGGIQVVALPAGGSMPGGGFAVIWHDESFDSNNQFDGYATKIRYFDANGSAVSNPTQLYTVGPESVGSLSASATSLGDGRIALVYANYDNDGVNGTDATQLSVGVVGALGSTFAASPITPAPVDGTAQTNWQIASLGGGNVAVSYEQGSGGNSVINTYNVDGEVIITAPCFTTGTLIRTARGEVAVEDLRVGDVAVTTAGAHRPIRWIGSRAMDCRRQLRPQDVMPVRVTAHAFGPNRPARDLRVSPGHALCLDLMGEVLVPACALVNGATVVQEQVDRVTYWHVELDSHDVILAEGLPAESYLEMGNRRFFTDGAVVDLAAGPDAPVPTHADFCRPFHAEGLFVEVARRLLRARAETLGWGLEQQRLGGLHLVVDGCRVEAEEQGLTARFTLPPAAAEVWMVSTANVPRDVGPSNDERRLGVSVSGLAVEDDLGGLRSVALDDARLAAGFHAVEHGGDGTCWRWTDGRARLSADLWAGSKGPLVLRVDLTGPALPRWSPPIAVTCAAGPRHALTA